MCIALTLKPSATLTKEIARNCYDNNPDGAGFAYCENGEVKIEKGFFDFEEFWDAFSYIQDRNHGPKLVHFRIATSGLVDKDNCHPWRVNDKIAIIHNGIISDFSNRPQNQSISDTGLFTKFVLKSALDKNPSIYNEKWFKYLISATISTGNKICLITGDEDICIYNEDLGEWVDDIWYSNSSYKFAKKKYVHCSNFLPSSDPKSKNKYKKTSYRYFKAGDSVPLTNKEIGRLTKQHKKRLANLISDGLVEKVLYVDGSPFYEDDELVNLLSDEEKYIAWLEKHGIEH